MNFRMRFLCAVVLSVGALSAQTFFKETFNNNAAGWSLDTEWAIGGAAASSGQSYGGPDPSADGDGITGGGIAGVVLGGNATTSVHGFYWLTSPVINTAGAGSLKLEFDRWLNSDYLPFMQNKVEVFDGTAWQTIWQTGASPGIQDAAWSKQTFALPLSLAGSCFKVRFGMAVLQGGAYTVSSWNLDNVKVSSGGYLDERFKDNSAGWTLDSTWGIGASASSSGQQYGGPDPSYDADGVTGGGVAGVVIGGNAPQVLHGYYHLTSPTVDTSNAQKLKLDYMRWLNSDYTPYMANRVEVYDGAAWQTIWQTGGSPGVQDNAWTPQSFDVTNYKNAAFAVRFAYAISNPGVYSVSSWNIDNVSVYDPTPALSLELCSNAPGALSMAVHGPQNATTVNAITLAPGAYPFGWFYGIDIPIAELASEVTAGFPFVTSLNGGGSFHLNIPGGIPSGLTLYGVSVVLGPNGLPVAASAPVTHTIP